MAGALVSPVDVANCGSCWCSVYVDNVVAQAPEQTNHAALLLEYKTGMPINQAMLTNSPNQSRQRITHKETKLSKFLD
jgi:hypothetical protein